MQCGLYRCADPPLPSPHSRPKAKPGGAEAAGGSWSVFQLDLGDLTLLGSLPQAPEDRFQQLDAE